MDSSNDDRLDALRSQLEELRRSVDALRKQHARLKGVHKATFATAIVALLFPAAFFTGLLSPRFKRVHAESVDAKGLWAMHVELADPAGAGRASFGVSNDSATLTMDGKGASIHASASSDALLTANANDQGVVLHANESPILGAEVILASKTARGHWSATRVIGERSELRLDIDGGTTTVSANRYEGKKFNGGLDVSTESAAPTTISLSVDETGSRLRLESQDDRKVNTVALETSASGAPSINLAHRDDFAHSPALDASIGLVAAPGKPWMFGTKGDEDAWKVIAKP